MDYCVGVSLLEVRRSLQKLQTRVLLEQLEHKRPKVVERDEVLSGAFQNVEASLLGLFVGEVGVPVAQEGRLRELPAVGLDRLEEDVV